MIDLRDQLATAMGAAYKIGNELGGGGMSRVFLADDLALGRTVVIKVLHPELAAGVNVERFKREVLLAARLQHPHIVPVLSAGEVDGLPYYVMPFVKGDSLATRVARGPLPIADVVHTMGDVAKALAYAHSEGVVHRDIKPDNILVSGGAATVADFGIAKALSSSRRDESEGLTTIGTSIGTAGYMAPEQVAGDPGLDHRADIYALGCVAYELLTGASPFAGKSPQQMLAAHVLEQPAPVREKRPDAPPALADLVMRCMAKDPADRPQTGEAVLAALDDVPLGATGSHEPVKAKSRRVFAVAFLAAFVAAAVAGVVVWRNRAPASPAGLTIAVAPFEVLDPNLTLWKEGLVDVLSRNLDGAAGMHTVSPSAAIKRWEGRVGRDEAAAFAKRVGAQIVLYGSLLSSGHDFAEAKVWILDTRSTSAPVEVQARDSSSRMDRLSDSLSVKLLSAIGGARSVGSVRSLGSGSLPAIKAFLQGAQYFRHSGFDSAAASFRQAIALDSTFAVAHAYLHQSLGWAGGSRADRPREAALGRHFLRPGLPPLDSLMIEAIAQMGDTTGDPVVNQRAAFSTLNVATERYPHDALAWYLHGDFRFHNDPHFSDLEALHHFNRAIEADSTFAPAYIHAFELATRYGIEASTRYLKPYLLDNRGKVFASQLAAKGGTADPKLRAMIDTVSASVLQDAFTTLLRMPDSAEAAVYLARAAFKRRDAKEFAQGRPAFIGLLGMRGHVAEAWTAAVAAQSMTAGELAVLGLVPADSAARAMKPWMAKIGDPWFSAMPALAMARDTTTLATAVATLSKALATPNPKRSARQEKVNQYFIAAAHAYYQLARADTAAATKEFDALPSDFFILPADQFIRARLIARTDPKRALSLLESQKMTGDVLSVARELEIGRLAERANELPRAVDAYTYVAGAWQNTDNEQLKNAVRESRDALKRLDPDGKVRAELTRTR